MQLAMRELRKKVTPRQLELLKVIAEFQMSRCYSPTIAELAAEVGTSRSTVFEHISALREKGHLSVCAGKARSLELTSKAFELLEYLNESTSSSFPQSSRGIRLAGRVAAGEPIEAIEDRELVCLESFFGSGDDVFALEVCGDSMIDDGICDGDYVICRRKKVADNGQLVVAIVDNENATVKRFYKEQRQVRLQPANEEYLPIYSGNCRIEGIVIGLVRKI